MMPLFATAIALVTASSNLEREELTSLRLVTTS